MDAVTLTLTDFLEARIAEREKLARWALEGSDYGVTREWRWVRLYAPKGMKRKHPSSSSIHEGAPTPAEVLAECAAKRVAIGFYLHDDDIVMGPTVRAMAAVYADHKDYRPEWRP